MKATQADFWSVITAPRTVAALVLSVGISLVVAALNAAAGTLIAAGVLTASHTAPTPCSNVR